MNLRVRVLLYGTISRCRDGGLSAWRRGVVGVGLTFWSQALSAATGGVSLANRAGTLSHGAELEAVSPQDQGCHTTASRQVRAAAGRPYCSAKGEPMETQRPCLPRLRGDLS